MLLHPAAFPRRTRTARPGPTARATPGADIGARGAPRAWPFPDHALGAPGASNRVLPLALATG
jgi:hypothetical protein